MATAGEMIKVIARALVRPQATVTSYYAALRKADFISTTGRGKSAQDLSSLDVARILIVMLSADALNESEAVTELVGTLAHIQGNEYEEITGRIGFEEALATIIQAKADSHHGRKQEPHPLLGNIASLPIDIKVTATHLTAEIIINSREYFFSSWDDCPPVTHPDEWSEVSIRERLLLRAMMEGMAVTRMITDGALNLIVRAMP